MGLEFYTGKQKTVAPDREVIFILTVFNVTLDTVHSVFTQELRTIKHFSWLFFKPVQVVADALYCSL